MTHNIPPPPRTSSDARAAIPMPTACRQVVVLHHHATVVDIAIGSPEQRMVFVRGVPATVIAVAREEDLTVLCAPCVAGLCDAGEYLRVPHADLVPSDAAPTTLVWSWPPLRLEGIQSR